MKVADDALKKLHGALTFELYDKYKSCRLHCQETALSEAISCALKEKRFDDLRILTVQKIS
jgi:hypothetical protein